MPLSRGPLVPIGIRIGSFVFKISYNRRTNERTGRYALPASLTWRRRIRGTPIALYHRHVFSDVGPHVWNGLPSALWALDLTFNRFRRGLDTYLFTLV